jgi:hypothetical protein
MEKMSDEDKKNIYQLLIFLIGCVGMYFWVTGGIDRCGSFDNTSCMMGDLLDSIIFLSLVIMIVVGLIGWFWTLLGILFFIGFIVYKNIF